MTNLLYLIASLLFIFGLKGLSSPKTACRGNKLGALGMLLAIVVTLLDRSILSYEWIILGLVIGSLLGTILAIKVQMTSMPQLVASLNGFGGLASALVAAAALFESLNVAFTYNLQWSIALVLSVTIGLVAFIGSFIAFAKLQRLISDKATNIPGGRFLNLLLAIAALVFAILFVLDPSNLTWFYVLTAISTALGITLVLPIGGADMPVVIALLNSYSGLAACATGFVLNNNVLIISGSLVGASGIILTKIMCKAMNRSLTNVLFGGAINKESGSKVDADEFYAGKVKSTSADEVAMLLENAQKVIIIPGYGLAVAQAQHLTKELSQTLEKMKINVKYAIHPVAGRMPGHMNVLLAEADVPYDQLVEMEKINPEFQDTDVVLVLGANDVTNPAARDDQSSPIYGMPVLEADKAKTVVVVKRSLSPGFAGIPNELFIKDNTLMLFADAKEALQDLIKAVKEL